MNKNFCVKYNIGKCKYSVSFHDGVSTHKDGSPFYDLRILKNKRDLAREVKRLKQEGYAER